MNQVNFGENVRRIRVMKGYSQQYMATRLGFKNPNQVSRIESSPEIPDMEIVNRIAEIYELPVAELLALEIRLDTPEKHKARMGIYIYITYLFAIGVGVVCANPAWILTDKICEMMGMNEAVRVLVRLSGGFVPAILCLKVARKVTRRFKDAYKVD